MNSNHISFLNTDIIFLHGRNTVEFPFEIDLGASNGKWHESINGKAFGLKHTVRIL